MGNESLRHVLDKAYEGKTLKEILQAPVSAIQGLSEGDAEKLAAAFHIKTVDDLASNKFFRIALAIQTLATYEK